MNERRPLRRPSARQPGRQRPVDSVQPRVRAAEALHRGPRPVGRQLEQRRRPASSLAPVRELAAPAPRPCSQLALPGRVVGVLHRQRRQRRQRCPAQAPHRAPSARAPARPIDQPSRRCGGSRAAARCSRSPSRSRPARSSGPRARSNGRRASRLGRRRDRRRTLRRRELAKVDHRQRDGSHGGADHLPAARRRTRGMRVRSTSCRAPISCRNAWRRRRRSQRVRPAVARAARCSGIAGPASWSTNQSRCCANDSGSSALAASGSSGGDRRALRRVAPLDRRPRAAPWMLEERPQRQLHAERLAHPRHQLRRQQRVAAEVEEIVAAADALESQHRAPDARHQLLRRRRGAADAPRRPSGRRGSGRRAAIELAVGGQRQAPSGTIRPAPSAPAARAAAAGAAAPAVGQRRPRRHRPPAAVLPAVAQRTITARPSPRLAAKLSAARSRRARCGSRAA